MRDRWVCVVDEIDLRIDAGEIVGLVGESGSGKSMTARALLGLVPEPGRVSGSIMVGGREVVGLGERQMRRLRGSQIGYVAQDATAALNPVLTVGTQLAETIRAHRSVSRADARDQAAELVRSVGIADPVARLASYPHHLSGGMRQRVAIAIALACDPKLLIADEPTTALDVTVQAQIMDLLLTAAQARGASVLLISHDLRLVSAATDRVNVMYAGRIVEERHARGLVRSPSHPYTRALLDSTPRLRGGGSLQPIEGRPPRAGSMPSGCRFHPRCAFVQDKCRTTEPLLERDAGSAACWFPLREDDRSDSHE